MEAMKHALTVALLVGIAAAQTPGSGGGGAPPTKSLPGGGGPPGKGGLPGMGMPGGGMSGVTGAGPAPREKTRLEKLLEDTYRYNAEIRLAEAKLVEAQAMLAKVRLDVTQKVVQAEAAIRVAELEVEAAASNLKAIEENVKLGVTSATAREKASQDLLRAKANLETARTNLDYITGKAEKAVPGGRGGAGMGGAGMGGMMGDPTGMVWGGLAKSRVQFFDKRSAPPSETVHNRLTKALKTTVRFDYSDKPPTIGRAIDNLSDTYNFGGVFAPTRGGKTPYSLQTPDYKASEMSLGAFLLMLEDDVEGLIFVVREYGIRACLKTEPLPEGALRLADFLKSPDER